MLEIVRLTLGPMQNNVYILGDHESGFAVVIDPSFDSEAILTQVVKLGWTLQQVWLTHGHFDHIAGVGEIVQAVDPPLPVGLHPADQRWYQTQGGAGSFGISIPQLPEVSIVFEHGMALGLADSQPSMVEVRHAPGHSEGHVMFYCEAMGVLFCGDVIFREGIGRTDLEGGDINSLLNSIHEQVLSLPDETRLLPGHGPESAVGYERENNPYLV